MAVIWNQIRIFDRDADFNEDGPRYTELTVMYHYCALFALKCHYYAYFAVIWIQIRIFYPDGYFDQDEPRYTKLTVMSHYWPVFATKYSPVVC